MILTDAQAEQLHHEADATFGPCWREGCPGCEVGADVGGEE